MGKKLLKLFWVKVVTAIIIIVIGILTITFAILQLNGIKSIDTTSAIRVVIGIVFLIFGLTELVTGIVQNDEKISLKGTIAGAIIIGVGVFLFLAEAAGILDKLVGYMLPILVACGGFAITFKGIIELCQKTPVKKWLALIIAGAVIGTLGVIFAAFNDSLKDVVWLILGLAIALGGVADLIIVIIAYKTGKKAANKVEEKIAEKIEEITPEETEEVAESKEEVETEEIEKKTASKKK